MALDKSTPLLLEKELIRILQKDFPLQSRPFQTIAQRFNLKEEDILILLQKWQSEGKLRQISAIFNPFSFAHQSSLFAFKVEADFLEQAIEVINSHPGVSHNYLRNHNFNLWFTLVVPPGEDLLKEAEDLFQRSGAKEYLYLPILKVFKISAVFNEINGELQEELPLKQRGEVILEISERDRILVMALQEPLPLVSEPFKEIAKKVALEEEEIFRWLEDMQKKGALRRFGALFKHQKLGYKENILTAWLVPEERIEEVGRFFANQSFITHCYLRKSYPHWPYNLYTMCHFKEGGLSKISKIAHDLKLNHYLALETIKELKKIRLKLFYKFEGG